MSERYWTVDEIPKVLRDWISETVALAINSCWGDISARIEQDEESGRLMFSIAGPAKPTEEDPSGNSDIYSFQFDFLDELTSFCNDIDDKAACISALNEMAAHIAKLIALVERQMKGSET